MAYRPDHQPNTEFTSYLENTNCLLDTDKTIDWVFALESEDSQYRTQDQFYSSL